MKTKPHLIKCRAQGENLGYAIDDAVGEVYNAIEKWPDYPDDIIHAAAVVCDECGEFLHEVMKLSYRDGNIDAVRKEAIQVAATAIRFIANLENQT
jgi:hypothetical protein